MTQYGRPVWLDQYPRARVPSHTALRGPVTTEVAVVGGGLMGCATAYAFAAAGVSVALVEAGRIGQGPGTAGPGWVADAPATDFHVAGGVVGLRNGRQAWRAWRRAALDMAALLRRLHVSCGLEPCAALVVARRSDESAALRRELAARRDAGLEATRVAAQAVRAEAGLDADAGLRTQDGFLLDPYRAALGLARAAQDRGALLFERSAVQRIHPDAKVVEVSTAGGRVHAQRVVVATGQPTALFASLAHHVKGRRLYHALTAPIPARVRRSLGRPDLLLADRAVPTHTVRWVGGDRLLVSGADGPAVAERLRPKTLIQRTGQLMYELSTLYPDISGVVPTHGWDTSYAQTVDGLPYIGPHRNFPRHLFAFGAGGRTVTEAYLAGRILLRCHLGEADGADEVFAFTRGHAVIR